MNKVKVSLGANMIYEISNFIEKSQYLTFMTPKVGQIFILEKNV